MNDKRILYESMLNEHTRIQNQISDIKAESYELNDQQKRDIQVLEKRQVQLMNQIKALFNGKYGK
jgi:phosphoglycerate-specific signal transduction histidine kinase